MKLTNKVIIVTGAGGGMGKAIALQLVERGAFVVGIDISVESLSDIQQDNFEAKVADVLDEQKISELFSEISNTHGKIDGLVNALGIAQSQTPIEEVSLEQWHRLLNVNATSLFITCKEAVKYMKPKRQGSIITIASISAVRPRPGLQSYIASKGAAESFSRAMAIELAPYSIRVNTIHPGPADTNMLGQFAEENADVTAMKDAVFKQSVPLGELIQPDDIAGAVVYLLSDGAKMVTGATLNVDGGRGL
ncbi:SDR family NAD(P)-dependent oxidoreductase [Sporosarcina sp. JAI121]|uniref:SDR family NAD(P)-dependent oxidoreductase n=1 Tax=Sporosarcina sp. JAI121 TaxID=2723064 RepID=UPI0015CDEF8B|nr:SDR family NAD(P)-dependent oxidoreductase [Sporosarcina sp. JAI121]NYF23259.1 3-oxoacyl-[acyl-carrier protein] reductase [Sporosarcina sp. JAI121]